MAREPLNPTRTQVPELIEAVSHPSPRFIQSHATQVKNLDV
ncbi:MAG: hypothetical protein ACKVT1_10615 [Dehalococcoidia bacterium]